MSRPPRSPPLGEAVPELRQVVDRAARPHRLQISLRVLCVGGIRGAPYVAQEWTSAE
jgi:hypothetical protein